MSILCKLGIHKKRMFEKDGNPAGPWVTIGKEYDERCLRCGKSHSFTLTRDMLP